jgi:pimeloyl-ACP methyl ester carboxylesterase
MPIRFYIEGDGHSWKTRYLPSKNPTPRLPTLIDLAKLDNYPNIVYIARPCQFVTSDKCEKSIWTNKIFSQLTINSMIEAIEQTTNKKFELVGYSGGATISLFVINKLPDRVLKFISIAGNLNPDDFAKIHKTTPNIEKDRILKAIYSTKNIEQIHLVGTNDNIVPIEIAQNYKKLLGNSDNIKIIEVQEATHSKNWQNFYKNFINNN